MYIKRQLETEILKASKFYPVVFVTGPRQVGKSTMLYHIKEAERRYVSLRDVNARRLAHNDPRLFFETYGNCLIIDEFQLEPALLDEIFVIIENRKLRGQDYKGLFWLTGSQKFHMMKNISESLAGRIAVFEMQGLSQQELEGAAPRLFVPEPDKLKEIAGAAPPPVLGNVYERIFKGSMPEVLTTDTDRDQYYSNYLNTYIERDVKDLTQVGLLSAFNNFIVCMAARTAQELKYEEIAKEIGVSAPTVKTWVSILESSGIIHILHPYFSNIAKRLVKTPKIYFSDTGLAAFLTGWPNAETLEKGNMSGAYFETYVFTEIMKSYLNTGNRSNLFYYRDTEKNEVDLLVVRGDDIYPVEIRKSSVPNNADKNFKVLNRLGKTIKPGLVICMSSQLIPYSKDVWYCPVTLL